MWKDILVIVVAIIAVLTWVGVTPSRIAQLVRRYITPNRLIVSLTVIVTLGAIYASVANPLVLGMSIRWGLVTGLLYLCFIMWQPIIDYYFSPRGRLRKAILLALRFGGLLVIALLWTELDMPDWRKLAHVGGGFLIGFSIALVEGYIRKRRSSKREQAQKT